MTYVPTWPGDVGLWMFRFLLLYTTLISVGQSRGIVQQPTG